MSTRKLPKSLGFHSSARIVPRRTLQALQPPRLHGLHYPPHGVIHEAPPWGLVIPAEAWEQGIPYHVSVETGSIPIGATVTLHWQHKDGSYAQQTSVEYEGSGEFVLFVIRAEWLEASIGKSVSLHYEVSSRNGSRALGPAVDIDMAPPLEVPPIRIEGLSFGEPLDPLKFPEAVHPIVDRIANARPYHECSFWAIVVGETNHGSLPVIRQLNLPLQGVEDGPVRLTVPASLYTGMYGGEIVRVYIHWVLTAQMLPPPNMDWLNRWQMGLTDVLATEPGIPERG